MNDESKRYRFGIRALVLAAFALSGAAVAQGQWPPPARGMGPYGARGPGGFHSPVFVAPDGTALYVKTSATTSGSTATRTQQLVAIGTGGAVAWTWTPPAGIRDIAFQGGLVAVAAVPQPSSPGSAVTSQVVGLNLSTGAQNWSASFDGVVGDLKATPNGLLCVVTKVTTSSAPPAAETVSRSLVALDPSGKTLWTVSLD